MKPGEIAPGGLVRLADIPEHGWCTSCHRLMDYQNKCRKGHNYTPETTLVNNRGHRWCLTCKEAKYATAN